MKPFENAESLISAELRRVAFTAYDFIGNLTNGGSYNIIEARLMGMSYPNYLRYVRDVYGATIVGNKGYSYPLFKDSVKCDLLVKELNYRWGLMLDVRLRKGLSNEVKEEVHE